MFELHPDAVLEAWAARRRYSEIDPALGERFYGTVEKYQRLILEDPHRWPVHLHGTRHVQVRGFPYHMVYLVESERVVLIAVAHAKRRPGYWQRRLKD